jgi:lipopolysaccharide transport system permease protein
MSAVAETQARAESRPKELPVVAYEPWKHGVWPRAAEAWQYRRLAGYVAVQFILKRYRQTYLGWLWLFLRPGIQILSTTFLFAGVLSVEYGDRPGLIYIAFSTAGWILFERSFHWGMRAVRMTRSLSKGLHLPRSLASVAAGAPAVVDFLIHSLLAVGAVVYYYFSRDTLYISPPGQWPIGFAGLAIMLAFGLGIGLFTGPLMMITKEVRYLQMYVLQLWMIITPIVYDIDHIPHKYKTIVENNPLAAPMGMVQYGFLSTSLPSLHSTVVSLVSLTVIVVGGLLFSSRFERAAVARL